MKVKISVVSSPQHFTHAEHDIDSWDHEGLFKDLEKVVDLYRLRAKERREEARKRERSVIEEVRSAPEQPDFGPHGMVFEYDGAFRCLTCGAEWGALSGKPVMSDLCRPREEESGCA